MTSDFWTEKEKELIEKYGKEWEVKEPEKSWWGKAIKLSFKECHQQHEKEIEELKNQLIIKRNIIIEHIEKEKEIVTIKDVEKVIKECEDERGTIDSNILIGKIKDLTNHSQQGLNNSKTLRSTGSNEKVTDVTNPADKQGNSVKGSGSREIDYKETSPVLCKNCGQTEDKHTIFKGFCRKDAEFGEIIIDTALKFEP